MAALIFIGILVALLVLWAGITALSAAFLMFAWNVFLPVVWVGAPHLTFWPAVGGAILLQMVGGIFKTFSAKSGD